MLTKEFLNFRVREGRLHPQLLKEGEPKTAEAAQQLLNGMQESIGQSREEVLEELSGLEQSAVISGKVWKGLQKIALDFCEFQSSRAEGLSERRLEVLELAQRLRSEDGRKAKSPDSFRHDVFEKLKDPISVQLRHNLYCDLPSQDRLKSVSAIGAPDLLHRYNVALLQGLLLHAQSVELCLPGGSAHAAQRRRLLHYIKFFGLIPRFEESADHLKIGLEGPLSVFEGAKKYGFQLASFFPAVLQLKTFELRAEVVFRGRRGELVLTEKNKVPSHFQKLTAYRPEDLQSFCDRFEEACPNEEWRIVEESELLQLRSGELCCPDFCFIPSQGHKKTNRTSQKVCLEIFHPWHRGPLMRRLGEGHLPENSSQPVAPSTSLLIAVDRRLLKDKNLAQHVQNSLNSGRCVPFSGVLSARQVLKSLNSIDTRKNPT